MGVFFRSNINMQGATGTSLFLKLAPGALAVALVGACSSYPSLRPAPGPGWVAYWNVWELTVKPVETDPKIKSWPAPHLIYVPADQSTPPRNLFVFLPGTGGSPTYYSDFLKAAARHGQHVIGLSYPNHQAIRPICNKTSDRDCHGNLRKEIILGVNASPAVKINRANSIEHRLVRLLQFLAKTYPDQNWDRYLEKDLPRWNLIAISGYSQGAGHAAYIAKHNEVLKAGLYSGPGDVNAPLKGRAVRWLEGPTKTPISRYAGFTHVNDEVAELKIVENNWRALGLSGSPISVDKKNLRSAISRQFITRLIANGQSGDYPNHAATVRDAYIPRDDRQFPVYLKVWSVVSFPDR